MKILGRDILFIISYLVGQNKVVWNIFLTIFANYKFIRYFKNAKFIFIVDFVFIIFVGQNLFLFEDITNLKFILNVNILICL